MKIESHFTANEIAAAKRLGATVQLMKYNRYCLSFPSLEIYNQWLNEQQRSHPHLWIDSFSVRQADYVHQATHS